MSSATIKKLSEGSYFDRITGFIRFGEKFPIEKEEREILERIEYVKNLLVQHKDTTFVIKLLANDEKFKGYSLAQRYNYIADAKALFAIVDDFNMSYELALQKERIDKAFKLAEAWTDSKMYAAALRENDIWMRMMQEEKERYKIVESKQVTFIFHMDFTQLGVTPQLLDEWKDEVNRMKIAAKRKYKEFDEPTDVRYTEG